MGESGGTQVSFQFQVGLTKDKVTVDLADLTLKSIKVFACNFINERFTDHGITRISERVMVFKHDYSASNILQMVNSATDVTEGSILEVVLNTQPLGDDDVEIRPHSLIIHSYKTPTFCDFCGEMLFGMFKQGLKCEFCGLNYHKRCVFKVPNDCSQKKKRRGSFVGSTNSTGSLGYSTSVGGASSSTTTDTISLASSSYLLPPSRDGSVSPGAKRHSSTSAVHGRPAWVDMQMATRLKIPHTFVLHTYTKPTKCHFCNKILVGVFKQGLQCKDCRYNAHKKCSEKVPRDCTGEVPDGSVDGGLSEGSVELEERNGEDSEGEDTRSRGSPDADDQTIVTPGNFESHIGKEGSSSDYIPVQRLVQSVKHTKKVGNKILKEGWILHYTNKDTTRKKHYWRLDSKCITMFTSDSGNKFYREVPLSEILSVDPPAQATDTAPAHAFQIKTANLNIFVSLDAQAGEGSSTSKPEDAKSWETAIKQALMPVDSGQGASGSSKDSSKNAAKDSTAMTQAAASEREVEQDISQAYQIFPEDVLGSGQFGIVYGGVHRMTGTAVAIKVIDKMRFPTKQEAALKNEVQILQNLHHPGVVNLERMFESPERIFVVMEKLKGDMLEMILSSEQARLSERITKFLVTQILVALKHLHSKNIVHCDLKPENVLLSSDSDFPQVKLCDFGFARMIGEKAFRKSVVGTPAYLAPEVLRNKGYNRSLDMWSTGVIIYVSLSGTFPFNEDEDIHEQIQNAYFMYPPHPWKEISTHAVDLINNLLQVKMRKRYTVDKSLLHTWLQDYDTWCDLRELEKKINRRWLTHESDDSRWESQRSRATTAVTEGVAT
jgi:protein kinase D